MKKLYIISLAIGFVLGGCGSGGSDCSNPLDIDNNGNISNGIGYYGDNTHIGVAKDCSKSTINITSIWTIYTDETNSTIQSKLLFKDDGSYCGTSLAPYSNWDCNSTYIYGVNKEGIRITDENGDFFQIQQYFPSYNNCFVFYFNNNVNDKHLMCW